MIRRASVAILASLLLTFMASCAAPTPAARADTSDPGTTSRPGSGQGTAWGVYVWDPYFIALHQTSPITPPGAVAGFPLQTNMTALLTTTSARGLLGNLTGKTLTASVSLAFTGSITYGLEDPNSCGDVPANVRFFISTDPRTYSPDRASGNETGYWWSNPANVPMDVAVSGAGLRVPLTPGNWSDANGHLSSDPAYTAGFKAAVANVQQIGLSFGGGCFFDTGIGITGGSGSFTLTSFSAR